jgi:hypothetical protein
MKKNIIYIILLIISLSCSKKEINEVKFQPKDSLTRLKERVVEKGDEKSFTELILKTGNSNSQYDILPYAMIMANKYKSGEGCHQVLLGILDVNNPKDYGYNLSLVKNFNDADKDLVIYYLQRGVELNNENCILALEKLYRNGWGVNKDFQKADELRSVYKAISK